MLSVRRCPVFGLAQRGLVCIGAFVCALAVLSSSYASSTRAASFPPAWQVSVAGIPSVLPVGVGRHGRFIVIVENTGGTAIESGAVLRDLLPAGLVVREAGFNGCSGEGSREVECALPEGLEPGHFFTVYIEFEETGTLTPGASLPNVARVSGGGSAEISRETNILARNVGETGWPPGGIADFSMSATGPAGEPASRAAGHPSLFNTSAFFNSQFAESVFGPARPAEPVKNLVFYLPLGMLGDALAADQCPPSLVETQPETTGCPPGSRIGAIVPLLGGQIRFAVEHGVYNVKPEKGYAAEFAFTSNNFTFFSYANVVRHDGTYMVRVSTPGVAVAAQVLGFAATFYGDLTETFEGHEEVKETFDRGAFLTNPSNCNENEEAREGSIEMDTWERSGEIHKASSMVYPTLTGCSLLTLGASLSVTPETARADAPTGVEVGLDVPQASNDFTALGTPPIKDTVVTLPSGTTISPSSANGLEACPATGSTGFNMEGAESEEVAEDGLERPAPGHCQQGSQIATVRGTSPLLNEELIGKMYLAAPECGQGAQGCTPEEVEGGKLIGLDLELIGEHSGTVVKLKGHGSIQRGPGRVTTSFENLPQFPVERLTVTTKQGPRAPLENAQTCGASTSNATVTPWSPTTPAATPSDSYTINWSGTGQPCPGSAPFAPSFTAGTTNALAASTSPFTLTLRREDREQDVKTISTTLPEGLLAYLSRVARCPEPQASENSLSACPAGSQIGTVTAAVGPGSEPYYVTGKVFLTGPYNGAPFGLSVVVPAVAGPFNLGSVLTRATIAVDPHTAQGIVTSDPLPQEIDGVPLRVRVLNVTLTNGEFVLNPTSCAKTSITGTVTSTTGSSATISSPFAAEGCKGLKFEPSFSVSTEAKATKANGTGVRVKVAYPASGQSNIAKVVIGFPKKLPVRLSTLQKACLAATFEKNPASCPAASVVGTAIAHTPILAQPATGPAYLVSYGNAKFPDVVFVLQSEGVTVDLDGQSNVSKAGALKATFASVPDVPVSTFETVLPAGPFSQFTSVKTSGKAHGSQCGEHMVAPVSLTAHNGAQLTKNVQLTIKGCAKKPKKHKR